MLEVAAVGALVAAAFTLYRVVRRNRYSRRLAEIRTVDRWIQAEREQQLFPRE